jgi:hypothetical protein
MIFGQKTRRCPHFSISNLNLRKGRNFDFRVDLSRVLPSRVAGFSRFSDAGNGEMELGLPDESPEHGVAAISSTDTGSFIKLGPVTGAATLSRMATVLESCKCLGKFVKRCHNQEPML